MSQGPTENLAFQNDKPFAPEMSVGKPVKNGRLLKPTMRQRLQPHFKPFLLFSVQFWMSKKVFIIACILVGEKRRGEKRREEKRREEKESKLQFDLFDLFVSV